MITVFLRASMKGKVLINLCLNFSQSLALSNCQALLSLGTAHNLPYKSFLQYFAQRYVQLEHSSKFGVAINPGVLDCLWWSPFHQVSALAFVVAAAGCKFSKNFSHCKKIMIDKKDHAKVHFKSRKQCNSLKIKENLVLVGPQQVTALLQDYCYPVDLALNEEMNSLINC